MTIFFASLSISLMIVAPLALAVALRRRYPTPWWLFCLGMATFIASQLYHLPLNKWLTDVGFIGRVAADAPSLLRTTIILGLSAGVSETLARAAGFFIIFRRTDGDRPGERWQDGAMVGLGHGGIEAMGFIAVLTAASITSLLALQGVDMATLDLSPDQLAAVELQMTNLLSSPWLLFLPLLERLLAIALHVVLSLLTWTAFSHRRVWYAGLAVLYHALVDGTLVYAGQFVENGWLLEGLLALMMLPGLAWAWRSRPRRLVQPRYVRPVAEQLALFVAATRKELLQQWRTKRMLVVTAVFLLFGLGSPLIAKFTPELLGSIEGVEQFADLIPVPTKEEAMTQYIKNITQFGFIIALLVGMGSVAGEKERSTTAMILSKPLPRWAFLLSKFTAQGLVYALGFLIASLGAHVYTLILFEPFAFVPFMFGNLLLLLWLLVFAAVTLLGSTVARSTGAAAGFALLGAVLLLLAGSLPKVGAFAPSGLVAWASRLGLEGTVANGGALVANVVIVVVCLVTAVAIFEPQEL